MNLHEYQAKELLQQFGVAVPRGTKVTSQQEAVEAAKALGGPLWVVKAQVHAGGRGKAGGVKLARSLQDVEEISGRLLGSTLVTKQTGAEGVPVHALLIQDGVDITNELYLSCLVDRSKKRIVFIGSSEGGMDIEEVAAKSPEKILTIAIDPIAGIQPYQCRNLGFQMGLGKDEVNQLVKIMTGIYNTFVQKDCSLVEINPLIIADNGQMMALDAKITLDDNAMYRHKDTAELRDPTQEDEREHIAHEIGLNYVTLDGNIGCMVNGAGLAMATMDVIKLHGGEPANFLDVGGGATKPSGWPEAFKLILSSTRSRRSGQHLRRHRPLRHDRRGHHRRGQGSGRQGAGGGALEGTNVEAGREMLAKSGMNIMTAEDLADAAKKAVAAAAK
jgi:succinyl-CoA synthetase beta subunit